MAGGEVSVKFSSQGEADVVRSLVAVMQKLGGVKGAMEETNEAAAKIDPALKRFAESVKNISADPLRELQRENAKLDEAIKAKLLTEQEAAGKRAQAQERYREQLRRTREESADKGTLTTGADGLPQFQQAAPIAAVDLYKQRVAELRAELKAGTIDQKTFDAAAKAAGTDYADQMRKARAEQEKTDASLKKFAQDLASVDPTPLEAHRQRMEKLNDAVKRGVIQQHEYESASKKSFDTMQREADQARAKIEKLDGKVADTSRTSGGMFSQMATEVKMAWAVAAGGIYKVLDEVNRATEEAAGKLKESSKGAGTIAQISTSLEEYNQLSKLARKVFLMGAANSMSDAQNFVIAMKNADAIPEIDKFSQLRKYGVMEQPEKMIAAAAGLQTSMGESKTGSKIDLTSMAFVAGGNAPDTAEQVLTAAGNAGVAANLQGASPEELLAVTSVLSKALGGSEKAGDRAKDLYTKLAIIEPKLDRRGRVAKDSPVEESFRGKPMEQILNNQRLATMTPAQLLKTFQSEQAVQAYMILKERKQETLELEKAIRDSKGRDFVAEKTGFVKQDSAAMAVIKLREKQNQLDALRQARGETAVEAEAAGKAIEAGAEDAGSQIASKRGTMLATTYATATGGRARGVTDVLARGQHYLGSGEMAGGVANLGVRAAQYISPELFLDLNRTLQGNATRQEEIQERQAKTLEQLKDIMDELNGKVKTGVVQAPQPRLVAPARQEQAANAN